MVAIVVVRELMLLVRELMLLVCDDTVIVSDDTVLLRFHIVEFSSVIWFLSAVRSEV